MSKTISYAKPVLTGSVQVPGDKSISHRAIMFGALAQGTTTIEGFLMGDDCLSTISCFRSLGIDIQIDGEHVTVTSGGRKAWKEPDVVLDTGNSGTTTRLMLGLLAGTDFHSVMAGDESIARRPMKRIVEPLRLMGADIRGRANGHFTPLAVQGTALQAIDYTMPVASAQVKSAVLLAGLSAQGTTTIHEPVPSRDHTEIMLKHFGADISRNGDIISLTGGQELHAAHVQVPGDISSAAFIIGAALIAEGSEIQLKNVGVNPTRTGLLDVFKAMGADIQASGHKSEGEEAADLTVRSTLLTGTDIGGDVIPRLIDEIPLIALVATQAQGKTVIRDAEELR
ncbi:3-phosphoshikimate 1-carboxyvinyltransferase, partial [Planococcus sp. A6]|uniref:3-phosphoshikimate 1-carboxyvinyltransferase n=1 Tax=Planococcus sp. A6 TaxID=2992760 RepID=UPI00237AFBB4